MAEFRRLLDFLQYWEFNTLILETGGAVEYAGHPEINRAWVEYARFMNEYPGKPDELRASFAWPKNSIHTANGGGQIVPAALVREMLGLCAERGIAVIPELPSLSHCDYLLRAYPEFAERAEDPYPDTVCPRHPGYRRLLEELLAETIELFQPAVLHLGHDEYYSMGLCPRCRGENPAELYAADVRACHDFLQARGVTMMMWGDKLLEAHFPDGTGCGGAEVRDGEGKIIVPATFRAIDLIPRDIVLMHWYWSLDRHIEEAYDARGFRYLFANLSLRNIPEWRRRSERSNVLGVCVSNWGELNERTLRRNAVFFDIASQTLSGKLALDPDADYEKLRDRTLAELYSCGRKRQTGPVIELEHTCDVHQEYRLFFDGWFVTEERDLLGWHVLADAAGREYRLPVVYGKNISGDDVSFDRLPPERRGQNYDTYRWDLRLFEVSLECLPCRSAGRMVYRTSWPDPAPGTELTYRRFEPAAGFTGHVELCGEIRRLPAVSAG